MSGFTWKARGMRADRLVAILMLLQTRGQVTSGEIAAELEVSERTARRDLDALSVAGLPIYSVLGRNGGWRLLGDGKTDLSGLTASEAQALFLLAGPRPASAELRAALRKLVRALPEPLREGARAASVAVFHDPAAWGGKPAERPRPPLLDTVESAVIAGRQVVIGYVDRSGNQTSRIVHPLGVATKGASWYLVGGTDAGQRTFRVDRMKSVDVSELAADRPAGFVLSDAWRLIADEMEEARVPIRVSALIDESAMPWMRHAVGVRLRVGRAADDGRVEVEIRGRSEWAVANELASFGLRVEVLEPDGVRQHLASIGRDLVGLYG